MLNLDAAVIQFHFFLIIYSQYLMMTNCNPNEINELIIAKILPKLDWSTPVDQN